MNTSMIRLAKLIFKHLFSYYKKYERLNGWANHLVWIDDKNSDAIVVFAGFSQRDKLKKWLEDNREY